MVRVETSKKKGKANLGFEVDNNDDGVANVVNGNGNGINDVDVSNGNGVKKDSEGKIGGRQCAKVAFAALIPQAWVRFSVSAKFFPR